MSTCRLVALIQSHTLLADIVHEGRGPTVEVGQVSQGLPRWALQLSDVLDE